MMKENHTLIDLHISLPDSSQLPSKNLNLFTSVCKIIFSIIFIEHDPVQFGYRMRNFALQKELQSSFLRTLLLLAADIHSYQKNLSLSIASSSSTPVHRSWFMLLPKEIRLLVIRHFCRQYRIVGKTDDQKWQCATFILGNISEIRSILSSGRPLLLMEKRDPLTSSSSFSLDLPSAQKTMLNASLPVIQMALISLSKESLRPLLFGPVDPSSREASDSDVNFACQFVNTYPPSGGGELNCDRYAVGVFRNWSVAALADGKKEDTLCFFFFFFLSHLSILSQELHGDRVLFWLLVVPQRP